MATILRSLEHPIVIALGWSLLHFVWQGFLLGGLLAILLIPLRRVSAHARYLVLCGGLCTMFLCLPVTWYFAFVTMQAQTHGQRPEKNGVGLVEQSVAADLIADQPSGADAITHDPGRSDSIDIQAKSEINQAAFGFTRTGSSAGPDLSASSPQPLGTHPSWLGQAELATSLVLPWLVSAWFAGVLFLSIRLLAGWQAIRTIRRLATSPASEVWQERLRRIAVRLQVARPVKLVESALVAVPTVIGWLRPMVLLPTTAFTGLDPSQLEALLAHELAHIRRNDFLINLVQTAIETLLFYHPAVWWLSRHIRDEREHCCDDMAVEVCGNTVTYARALASMEELRGRATLTMAADGGSLLSRIKRLLYPAPEVRRSPWGASLIVLLTVALLGAGAHLIAQVTTDAAPQTEPLQDSPTVPKFVAALPGEIRVELLGVAYHPSEDRPWWRPDGSARATRPYDKLHATVFSNSPEQTNCREFQLELRGLPPAHGVKINYGAGISAWTSDFSDGVLKSSGAAGSFQSKTTSIRVGISAEPFGPKLTIDSTGTKTVSKDLKVESQTRNELVIPLTVEESEGRTELLLHASELDKLQENAEFKIVAIDKQSVEHQSIGNVTTKGARHLVFPIPLARLARFEFSTRPYRHWVKFENVSLHLDYRTDVKISTESIPETEPTGPEQAKRAHRQLVERLIEGMQAAADQFASGRLDVAFQKATSDAFISGKQNEPLIRTEGTFQWLSDAKRWRVDYDGQQPQSGSRTINPDKWTTGFDGSRHFNWEHSRNRIVIGGAKGHAEQYAPVNLFWNPTSGGLDAVLKALARPDIKISEAKLDKLEGYHAEYTVQNNGSWKWSAFICPQRGYLTLELQSFYNDRLAWECKLSDLVEVRTGVWYPKIIERSSYTWSDGGERGIAWQDDFKITGFQQPPELKIPPGAFLVNPPIGADVNNLVEGLYYQNDLWWNDLAPVLREKYQWPRTPLTRLSLLNSNLKMPVDGKTAPELGGIELADINPARGKSAQLIWLNSKPLNWKQLDGKVTLIVFWSHHDERCLELLAALKRLHEIHGPSGLHIIAIHFPARAELVQSLIQEFQLPFPVAIDSDNSFNGTLYGEFGLRGLPTGIFVDHTHKLHAITQPDQIPQQLVTLLTHAGAKNPPQIVLHEDFSDELYQGVRSTWLEFVSKAPKTASVVGKVVDGQNQPIANAQIEATLAFQMMDGVNGAHMGFADFKGKQVIQTDANGVFSLPNLAKGGYEFIIQAPGKATRKQHVVLKEGEAQIVKLTLDFPDFISGRVVTQDGRPISNATLKVRYRHDDPKNLNRHTSTPGAMPVTKSDANGRFRFEKLELGHYTFDISAEGFEPSAAEKVLLGRSDLEVTLQPAKKAEATPVNKPREGEADSHNDASVEPRQPAPDAIEKESVNETDTGSQDGTDRTKVKAGTDRSTLAQNPLESEATLDAVDEPLEQILLKLARDGKFQLEFDLKGLEEARVSKRVLCNVKISGIRTRNALRLLLEPHHLGFLFRDNVLRITSLARATDQKSNARTRTAIKMGLAYLKSEQLPDGSWASPDHQAGSMTAMATAAMLLAGTPADDPAIQKSLKILRKNELKLIYTVSLQTMVFCMASPKEDGELIRQHVAWIEKAQVAEGPNMGGWSYGATPGKRADGSCSRFAVLGLHAAHKAGFAIKPQTWQRVSQYWLSSQRPDGQWGYTEGAPGTATMTLSGIAALATVQKALPKDDLSPVRDAAMLKGAQRVPLMIPKLSRDPHPFYAFHCLERAGNLTGVTYYEDVDWKAALTTNLLDLQREDGAWSASVNGSSGSVVETNLVTTSFALLSLCGDSELPTVNAK